MTNPCGNTERFQHLEAAVAGIRAAAEATAKSHQDATSEIRSLGHEMRNLLGDMRERTARDSQKLEDLGKGVQVLFQFKRDLEDTKIPAINEKVSLAEARADVKITDVLEKRIMPIEIQHLKEQGAAAAFKDIKVMVPSLLATGLALIQLIDKGWPWLKHIIK